MKQEEILQRLLADKQSDSNVLGFLIFGSVATGTHRPDSDIDVLSVLQVSKPTSGINNTMVDSIKVGDLFFTYDILTHSVEEVPYLLHTLVEAKLLFDRDGQIQPHMDKLRMYFDNHPEIVIEWDQYKVLLKQEKAQFGYEKTTIVDVWNELEKRHSGRKIKRRFFNAFYMTNPFIFSLLKKLM